jgi:hypothetical protein
MEELSDSRLVGLAKKANLDLNRKNSMSIIKAPAAALLLLSLILLVAGQALAQAPPERRTTRENIVTLMLLRMIQVLDIDEEQAARQPTLIRTPRGHSRHGLSVFFSANIY